MDRKATQGFVWILVILGILLGNLYIGYSGETDVTDKVIRTDRIVKDNDAYYVVFCQNETFQMTDALLKGRFNTSDDFKFVEPGQTYKFHVIGKRVPILSHYRNILSYQKI